MKKLKIYKGAGIALLYKEEQGYSVFLGKRKFKPYAQTWSFPGGKKEKDDTDYYECAIREFEEETSIPFNSLNCNKIGVLKICLLFFNWQTFIFMIDKKITPHNRCEFSEFKWIPLNELKNYTLHRWVMSTVKKCKKTVIDLMV